MSAWSRLRRRLARHRRLAAVGAAAFLVLVATLGWALETRAEASARERLARRFTEMVERIEAMARYSALSPLHDIRPDQAAMRARMAELEAEIRRAGAVALGPGHYALGRGYLALDDDDHARAELDAAWQAGYREPRVAYALALALGHLYQQALLATERIEDKELRVRKQREIEQQLRAPALAHLQASRGADVPSPGFVAALTAYYAGDLDEALRQLDAIKDGLPWFYEAPKLRGDVLSAQARVLRDKGEREGARDAFAAARQAFGAASAIGESVPTIRRAIVDLEYAALVMATADHGDAAPVFERGLAAADRALSVIPDDYDTRVLLARIRRLLATYRTNQGSQAEGLLRDALVDAQRAIASAPALPQARLEVARIYRQWGEQRQARDLDPGEPLRQAVTAAEAIAREHRDAVYHLEVGLIFKIWADYEDRTGAEAAVNRTRSIESYLRAVQIDDRLGAGWVTLGSSYFLRATHPGAEDPDGDLARAMQSLTKARAIAPGHLVGAFYQAKVEQQIAQRERARGRDPRPGLRQAIAAYETALAISPRLPQLHNGKGLALMELAQSAWDHGEPPGPFLDQAQAAFERAIDVAPDHGLAYGNLGEVHLRRAEEQVRKHQDPVTNLHAAMAELDRAIKRIPGESSFWADRGAAYAIQAEYELGRNGDPRPSLGHALSELQTALTKNPKDAQARRWLGESRGIQARYWLRQQPRSIAGFPEAAESYQSAVDLDPGNQDCQLAFGRFLLAWAIALREAGMDAEPPLQRGLGWTDSILGIRPDWPDVRILRARLLLLRAQATSAPEERRALGTKAEAEFTSALARNSALAALESEYATAARQIATAPP